MKCAQMPAASRTGRRNYAGKIGLATAIDYCMQWGLDKIWSRIQTLASQLRTQLSALPGVTIQDRGLTKCGIVTFTVEGLDPEEIQQQLAALHINVSVSIRSSTHLDMEARGLTSIVRASVHYYNTEEEISQFVGYIERLIS